MCYVDEAGNTGVYDQADPSSSPVFVLAGVSVDDSRANDLLMDYLRLKQRFEPTLRNRQFSDVIQHEVKGATLRRDIRSSSSRNTRRRALGFTDHVVTLLERYGCQVYGRVLVKQSGVEYGPATTYPSAVADMAVTLDRQACDAGQQALMILDAQTKVKNEGNVHTITTRRFRHGGNVFPTLIESPVFGHSDTHVLLQVADIVASALVYPAACAAYMPALPGDPHRDPSFAVIRSMFGMRLARLEYRFQNGMGDRRGGFRVIDQHGGQPTSVLFRAAQPADGLTPLNSGMKARDLLAR